MNPLQLTGFEQTKDALQAEILPLFKLHARLENSDEDALLPRYIGGAINAAENYLQRDVWPTTREWTGDLLLYQSTGAYRPAYGLDYSAAACRAFVVRRGRATVTLADAQGQTLDPTMFHLLSSADPKTWGFQITAHADLVGITVTATLGFPTFAGMPDDLQLFVLDAASAAYEVRELANYGAAAQGVETASYIPTYMLGRMGKFDLRIRPGQLRHRVTFLRRVPGQDAMGQPNENFTPMFTAWAAVDPLNGREFFGALHYVDEVDSEIRLRYAPHADLRASDRAQVDGEQGGVYDIQAVLAPEQRGSVLRVLAKRVT